MLVGNFTIVEVANMFPLAFDKEERSRGLKVASNFPITRDAFYKLYFKNLEKKYPLKLTRFVENDVEFDFGDSDEVLMIHIRNKFHTYKNFFRISANINEYDIIILKQI